MSNKFTNPDPRLHIKTLVQQYNIFKLVHNRMKKDKRFHEAEFLWIELMELVEVISDKRNKQYSK